MRVERTDAGTLRSPKRMDNGFMRVDGYIARTGIQEYFDANGKPVKELRLPEDVFDLASVESFRHLPVTNQHPPAMLTAKTAKQYSVGSVGEVRQDGQNLSASMMITDAEAILAIENGRTQLSNGYSCELATADPALFAEWGPHDFIQKNIRGNHVAIVDNARCGEQCSLKLDCTDKREKTMSHKLKMDGMEFEVSDPNAQAAHDRAIAAHKERADAAEASAAAKDKTVTELQAKLDVFEAERKERPARIAEEAKKLSALYSEAEKHLGENAKVDFDEMAIRKAVIAKLSPKVNLDGKDESYIRAAYDTAVAMAAQLPQAIDKARAIGTYDTGNLTADNTDEMPSRSPEEARARMIERNRRALVK